MRTRNPTQKVFTTVHTVHWILSIKKIQLEGGGDAMFFCLG